MKRESRLLRLSMLSIGLALGSLAGGWLAGCRGSALNPKSDLELRLDAANAETVVSDRNKSLASIASDASEEGDFRTTQKALLGIRDQGLKDTTAAECAVRLVKASDRGDANKLTLTIKDPLVRNDTLKRLAGNDVGSTDPAGRNAPLSGH